MISGLTLTTSLLLLVAICAGAPAEEHESFEYFRVYKVELKDAEQIEMFQQLEVPVNVLSDIGPNGGSLDVVVAPKDRINFEKSLEQIGAPFKCIIENLRETLDERIEAKPGLTTLTGPAMEWTEYHSLSDIYDFVDYLAATYPKLVTNYTIGYSYEGRPIKALKISCHPGNKAIFMDSNIHAVEWISSAATTCFVNQLLTSTDKEIQRLLCAYDWILVPVVNPDGFEYSKVPKEQKLWRKNRKPTGFSNSSGICYGTDMNRNFDDGHFKEAGHNIDVPCDHWYGGSEPNSEPEIIALQHFFDSFPKSSICMYLTFHSFGNFVLLPYGYTKDKPPNFDNMMAVAGAFSKSASTRYGTDFVYGSSGDILYPVSGSAKDWAYNKRNVPFSATIELRPYSNSTYMFFLPAEQITEVCLEITDGMIGMMKEIKERHMCKKCSKCY